MTKRGVEPLQRFSSCYTAPDRRRGHFSGHVRTRTRCTIMETAVTPGDSPSREIGPFQATHLQRSIVVGGPQTRRFGFVIRSFGFDSFDSGFWFRHSGFRAAGVPGQPFARYTPLMESPARFIVLDGNEGCGKSTQARLLHERLVRDGVDSILVRDPGTTPIGEGIRAMLLDPKNIAMAMRCEMLLYMAARAQLMAELILPALQAGKTVICDRFVSSTLAYQLDGDGLTRDEIRGVAEVAIKGRWPDLILVLDMPPEAGMARVKRTRDRIEQRPPAYHEQVRKNYLAQVEESPGMYRLVSAEGTIEEVQARVWEVVGQGTEARRHGGTK